MGAGPPLVSYLSSGPRYPAVFDRLVERIYSVHDVVTLSSGTKRLHHPVLGDLELEQVVLQLADDPEQKLVTFTAEGTHQQRIAQLIANREK